MFPVTQRELFSILFFIYCNIAKINIFTGIHVF